MQEESDGTGSIMQFLIWHGFHSGHCCVVSFTQARLTETMNIKTESSMGYLVMIDLRFIYRTGTGGNSMWLFPPLQ